jgi:uncharacterized protein YegL
MLDRPGGEVSSRPIHFIWITDCSGSMQGEKISALNTAIRNSIPEMKKVADDNAQAKVLVRAISFSDTAKWHISQPTEIDQFQWVDLIADGPTSMGQALKMVAEQMKMPPMTDRGLPPVLVLITDGEPTDDFKSGLKALMSEPWGKKSVRIGIAIGGDANLEVIQEFIGNPEIKPLQANNAQTLVAYIRWASTAVLKSASSPTTQTSKSGNVSNVPIPQPNEPTVNNPTEDVW